MPDKIDLKVKITRDKEGHYLKIKGSIQEEDITIVNIYAPNIGAPQYIRQTLTDIKGEGDSNTVIVGDFNNPLTPMDRSSKQKINKETSLKWHIRWNGSHWYLQDILSKCRRIHLLKCTWNILQDRPHLGSQIKPCKLKKIEIISGIFSDHIAMRLDINYKKKSCKNHNHMEIKQHISK